MENRPGKEKSLGRPRLSETKATTVGIRLSDKEREFVRQKARSVGLRPTSYIRQIILEGRVRPRLSEEERVFVRQLVGFSNNINQVAKACHEQGFLIAMGHFQKIGSKVEQVLEKLTR